MNFEQLVERIAEIHERFGTQAFKAVNVCLTCRNWLAGLHIKEYELGGADRAKYGSRLYQTLAERLAGNLDACYTPRYLQLCRQFYDVYPQIAKSLISQSAALPSFAKSLISQLTPNREILPANQASVPGIPPETLITSLSFTHFIELIKIEPPLKRAFYEIECVRGNWAVR
jgi:hypothetical protein